MNNKVNSLVKSLEDKRGSRLIVYVTGDRQPFSAKIAGDVVPWFGEQLEKIGNVDKISLFLYTLGGDPLASIRVVKLIRSRCNEFEVIVPYKAHSAGTLIAMGADVILMGRLGELTPVDASTGHKFNPQDPANPKNRLEISVEDLNSYFLLAQERANVKDEQMVEVYRLLVEKLHPLAIGNAYRAYRMTRLLTERLLGLHMDLAKEKDRAEEIIKKITGDITIHAYPIDREEAIEVGLKVERPSDEVEELMKELYQEYANEMRLNQPFHPTELLDGKDVAEFQYEAAYIDSTELSYRFTYKGKVQKTIRENKPMFDVNTDMQQWVKVEHG